MRVISNFYSREARLIGGKKREKENEFSKEWYAKFGKDLVEIICRSLQTPEPKKVRYFELQCLFHVARNNPDLIKKFAKQLQYEILPNFLKL